MKNFEGLYNSSFLTALSCKSFPIFFHYRVFELFEKKDTIAFSQLFPNFAE